MSAEQHREIIELFRGVAPFSTLAAPALAALAAACEVVDVRGGTYLVRAGEKHDSLYGVMQGALRIVRSSEEDDPQTIRELYRGETLGVLWMFVERPAPVGVVVIRDSRLVRLSRERFLAVTRTHPALLDAFARVMGAHVLDLLGTVTAGVTSSDERRGGNLALIALSLDAATRDTMRGLASAMLAQSAATHVTAHMVERALGHAGSADDGRVTEWLGNLERGRRALVYESDLRTPAWTARCVRQSDRLVIVTSSQQEARLDELATKLARTGTTISRQIHLVLVHSATTALPSGTRAWSRLPGVTRIHHVRSGDHRDLARVVRNLLGRPVGVALSGGAARGIAHLGVLAAIDEAGVPIDYICGTSMGAIFAAGAAQGWNIERLRASVKELFRSPFALYDLTLPVSSLLAGKKLDRVMRKYYGDADIEDLWTPFFCVSTDLSHGTLVVHDRGSLWKSVRASVSIPGIFPPFSMGGRALVDGGLMDNLPVDLLAERCPGTILAVDVFPYGDPTFTRPPGFVASRLRDIRSRLKGEPASPPLFDILVRSTLVGSKFRQVTNAAQLKNVLYLEPPVGSFGMLAWRAHAELFEAGYRYARERLASSPFAELAQRAA